MYIYIYIYIELLINTPYAPGPAVRNQNLCFLSFILDQETVFFHNMSVPHNTACTLCDRMCICVYGYRDVCYCTSNRQ